MRYMHVVPKEGGRALARVVSALDLASPLQRADSRSDADLLIYHVIGRREHVLDAARRDALPYAVIQYCLESTMSPHAADWLPLWQRAEVVMSYLDLRWPLRMGPSCTSFNFLREPLGVDSSVFVNPCPTCPRLHQVMTSGLAWTAESVREVAHAASGPVLHLGRDLHRREIKAYIDGVTDSQLSALMQTCRYVSGLRRKEGFELPAAEGLMCGARPILFDREHYRHWYGDSGVYVQEGPREDVLEALRPVLRATPKPVTPAERRHFVELFNWQRIANNFWRAAL